MSTSNVKATVRSFICREGAGVLALVGDWGVGKTYFWNSEVKVLGTSLARKKYAYVSLFGVLNLNEVKDLIFQRTVPTNELNVPVSVETAGKNTQALVERFSVFKEQTKRGARKHFDVLKSVPKLAELGRVMSSLAFFSVRDTLICIDDIERASAALAVEEVLGLISQLKEERNCQVVLLLNRDAMNDKVAGAYAAYRDKVIDIEVEFSPEAAECVDLVVAVDHPYHQSIKDDATRLNITNMRVLQRCVRMLDELRPLLTSTEESLQRDVVHAMVLFCWMWFHRREGVPSLEHALLSKHSTIVLSALSSEGKDADVPHEEKQLHKVLSHYGFYSFNELDHCIAEYVKVGYVNLELMQTRIAVANEEARVTGGGKALKSAFSWYYDSFDDNEGEGINALQRLWQVHGAYLSAGDLQQTVGLFRKLGRERQADALVDQFIQIHRSTPTKFNLKKYRGGIKLSDPYLQCRFNEAYAQYHVDNTDIRQVVSDLARSNGWNQEQIAYLAAKQSEDFYTLFKSSNTSELYNWIKTLLDFGHIQNAREEYLKIADDTKEALRRIAKESALNHARVKSYDIDPDELTE